MATNSSLPNSRVNRAYSIDSGALEEARCARHSRWFASTVQHPSIRWGPRTPPLQAIDIDSAGRTTCPLRPRSSRLISQDHGRWPQHMPRRNMHKSRIAQPLRALIRSGFKAVARLQHDVQARKKADVVPATTGSDHRIVDEDRSARGQRRVALGNQRAPFVFAKAVQQVSKTDHIRARQLTLVHVAGQELKTLAQTIRCNVILKNWLHC